MYNNVQTEFQLQNKLHKSHIDCNKITQKSRWDRQGPESESPSNERLRLRAKTRTPVDSDSTPPNYTKVYFLQITHELLHISEYVHQLYTCNNSRGFLKQHNHNKSACRNITKKNNLRWIEGISWSKFKLKFESFTFIESTSSSSNVHYPPAFTVSKVLINDSQLVAINVVYMLQFRKSA